MKSNFLTYASAAKFANMSTRHLSRLFERDNVPTFIINHKKFVLTSQLEAWMASRPVGLGGGPLKFSEAREKEAKNGQN